jgi:hypothetical protein
MLIWCTFVQGAWGADAETICQVHEQLQQTVECDKKTKLRGLSPRANYTDRATAAYTREFPYI